MKERNMMKDYNVPLIVSLRVLIYDVNARSQDHVFRSLGFLWGEAKNVGTLLLISWNIQAEASNL